MTAESLRINQSTPRTFEQRILTLSFSSTVTDEVPSETQSTQPDCGELHILTYVNDGTPLGNPDILYQSTRYNYRYYLNTLERRYYSNKNRENKIFFSGCQGREIIWRIDVIILRIHSTTRSRSFRFSRAPPSLFWRPQQRPHIIFI
jgi:hypothetical protein